MSSQSSKYTRTIKILWFFTWNRLVMNPAIPKRGPKPGKFGQAVRYPYLYTIFEVEESWIAVKQTFCEFIHNVFVYESHFSSLF